MKDQLKKFLTHPSINKAWIASQIYGDSTSKNRKKISLRLNGLAEWQPWEIEKLDEIIKKFKSTI